MATQREQQSNIKVRVNRAFWLNGETKQIGDEVVLPLALASELAGAGKVERADFEPTELHKALKAQAEARAKRKASPAPTQESLIEAVVVRVLSAMQGKSPKAAA